ncbi:hypothetical protein [Salinicola rhizosphaerae]|uniref:Uncharacterized protein n=1 Tax=Salinicola rhizosphaerae TaxID=1443141 RepID=A0ABQ3E901_9GAMM|nr:hypothetical protein [Salinicola rhizosphaerae]GHB27278.1 hypothetical protein GCM10009038_27430 [Salinicola rhizosphaerae]
MPTERSQLYYTCVFLHVSFQAVQASIAPSTLTTPCWLDSQMLKMLLRELKRSREASAPFADVHASLDTATYHCGLLMAQCPAALDRQLCRYHLEAIIVPLRQAVTRLSGNDVASHGTGKGRRIRDWLKR